MMAITMLAHPMLVVAPCRNMMRSLAGMIELAATAISLRTLLRAQSLRGHNGTAGPPPNLRWTLSVASGMLGCALLKFKRWNVNQLGMTTKSRDVARLMAAVLGFASLLLLVWLTPVPA